MRNKMLVYFVLGIERLESYYYNHNPQKTSALFSHFLTPTTPGRPFFTFIRLQNLGIFDPPTLPLQITNAVFLIISLD